MILEHGIKSMNVKWKWHTSSDMISTQLQSSDDARRYIIMA